MRCMKALRLKLDLGVARRRYETGSGWQLRSDAIATGLPFEN